MAGQYLQVYEQALASKYCRTRAEGRLALNLESTQLNARFTSAQQLREATLHSENFNLTTEFS
jgi:hypothetical protein